MIIVRDVQTVLRRCCNDMASLQLSNKYEADSREAEIVRDAWAWRELLQRGIDGYDATEDGNPEGLSEYEDLPGPWPPVTGGYQVTHFKTSFISRFLLES